MTTQKYQEFRLAIKGWAFCNAQMLKDRIEAGRDKLIGLEGAERAAAESTLASMERALKKATT